MLAIYKAPLNEALVQKRRTVQRNMLMQQNV